MTPYDPPRIYVACLAAYNNGRLHGDWLDADQEPETLDEAVHEMLRRSPEPDAEEWAIHDHEGFTPYQLHEYERLADVSEIAQGIVEHGPVFAALLDHHDGELDDTRTAITEEYHAHRDRCLLRDTIREKSFKQCCQNQLAQSKMAATT